jgi:two-component system capsular synthesis response regulator RcsB
LIGLSSATRINAPGVAHALSGTNTIEVVATAHDSSEVMEQLDRVPCDILITDYSMPGGKYGDGIGFLTLVRRRFPDLAIIVFTMVDNPAIAYEMSRLGVRSVVSKSGEINSLVSAIHAVYVGALYFPTLDAARRQSPGAANAPERPALSKREAEVVRMFVSGLSVGEISKQLHRSKQTVSTQKTSAMRKLGLEREADLFRFAYETGIMGEGVASVDSPPADAGEDE